MLCWRALIDPGKDLRRVAGRSVGRHEHRDRDPATRAPRSDLMDAVDMTRLAVAHSGALERPSRLFAVVADRDSDEPRHAASMAAKITRGQRLPTNDNVSCCLAPECPL